MFCSRANIGRVIKALCIDSRRWSWLVQYIRSKHPDIKTMAIKRNQQREQRTKLKKIDLEFSGACDCYKESIIFTHSTRFVSWPLFDLELIVEPFGTLSIRFTWIEGQLPWIEHPFWCTASLFVLNTDTLIQVASLISKLVQYYYY